MDVINLINAASKNGFTTVFIAMLLALFYKFVSAKIEKNKAVRSSDWIGEKRSQKKLDQHRLFIVAQHWIEIGIDRIPFPRRYKIRAKMYRDMLKIFVLAIENVLRKRLPELESAKTNADWQRAANAAMAEIINSYKLGFEQAGVPDIVISTFYQWHDPAIRYITHTITTLTDSEIAENNRYKTFSLLNSILSATKTAFYDAERTLIKLNGELTGLEYRGQRIE
jgi:hypothetical protein